MNIRDVRSNQFKVGSQAPKTGEKDSVPSMPRESVSLGGGKKSEQSIKLNILHMNDVHGAVEPINDPEISGDSPVGGLAYGKSVIEKEKAKNPDGTLVLNAGDIAEGSMIAFLSKGQVVADAFNQMGFDAIALGNHDFAWGQENLKNMVEGLNAPVIAANVEKISGGRVIDGAEPYVIKNVRGVKVGIIGLDTPNIEHFIEKSKLKGLRFAGAAETVKKWMPEVKEKGADIIVVLSHLGFEEDKKLARQVDGIDVIVGGHSHSEVRGGHQEGKTIIVQAGSLGKYVGNLELTLDSRTKKICSFNSKLIPVKNNEVKPDPEVERILKPYQMEAEKIGSKVMGEALEDIHHAHRQAAKLNQIHADSLLEASGAEFGICNSRTLRGNLKKGKVTYKDLYNALPFTEENYVKCRATGKMILDEIEDDLRDDATELAVPTGLKYEYDPDRPEGSRVTSITIDGGKPLEMDREYTVVLNETMSRKKFFDKAKDKKVLGGCQKIFFDYFKKNSPFKNDADDRVKVVKK